MYYQKQEQRPYYPRRPLHSFQDLEVYQKALECSVLVAREVNNFLAARAKIKKKQAEHTNLIDELLIKNMLPCALGIPHQVAEAHSLRFGDHIAGIAAIEKAMLNCNKMIVYLEQFRDICESGIPWEFFDGAIKKYIYVRRKMLRLEQAWKKFMPGYKKDGESG
ncbi:MAG: hypothetical protein A3J10_02345 [Candidatus Sungbacteria bacterium RIFCSPLOWO2_02_FULL_54_10]|uniref:Uncharacterized protein n=2 Tax=Candidatus Sungiibacteriota TaxID=1817917 RepID=A0A1G2L637_9BACT|nr:MAG: hypothetical protein A2679_01275 [Candidatus Sungbacteria bacterium RIFCSPHIGHO2_01_FULL_54_26]OHA03299.1 MAG: hypothetical protein A3C92_03460 [Candidatus Sungbacteria bacterium RIFCSPHIGHO2_02_FULL_53_17]OHA07115.1 MAG: hypothetical protein A3B34_02115 [Candidatus Sungbacteria bacterium RIFCSPLOWO2_01_FULL_54_21]OHA12347.1 MAG: hypothetical protein A3J10_02345 [Candidatus Sungbacteria bacterium RIFCSPLOWO2_02_FULL_54_10]